MDQYNDCPLTGGKLLTAKRIVWEVSGMIKSQSIQKMNAVWLEAAGCSGNIISLLNSENPYLYEVITDIVNFTYENSIMGREGEAAYESFLNTLDTEFILLVEGAISTNENGNYNIIANYKGKSITAYEAVLLAAEKAKYIVAVGTCASYGGLSAAKPNPAGCISLQSVISRPVIRLPGCPCHPDWVVGTLAHLVGFGTPELDTDGRPILFYGVTIHDNCTRRGFFDQGKFASSFGEPGCMFHLGCRGPVTRSDCPRRKWVGYVNWPIGNNTNCIGCAQPYFPDGMEPFIRY